MPMKKIIMVVIIIIMIGGSVEWYLHRPKKLKEINIPGYVFSRELVILGGTEAKGDVAHLYENENSYWVRYETPEGSFRDINFKKNDNRKYNAVRIISSDSCELAVVIIDE